MAQHAEAAYVQIAHLVRFLVVESQQQITHEQAGGGVGRNTNRLQRINVVQQFV